MAGLNHDAMGKNEKKADRYKASVVHQDLLKIATRKSAAKSCNGAHVKKQWLPWLINYIRNEISLSGTFDGACKLRVMVVICLHRRNS